MFNNIQKRHWAFVAIILSSILWSTAGISGKILLEVFDPFVAGFYRFAIASVIILPFVLFAKKQELSLKLLIISVLGAFNVPLFYLGLKTTTASSAQIIYAGCPLVTMLFANYLIKEKSSLSKIIGIFIGLFGVVLIILLPKWQANNLLVGDLTGNLFILLGMITWSLYTVFCRDYMRSGKSSPATITAIYFIISAVVCFILVILTGQNFNINSLISIKPFFALIYAAIIITLITYFLFQWAMQYISATTASLKNYLEPMMAIFLNVIILNEVISGGFIIGGLLIISGIFLTTSNKLKLRGLKTLGFFKIKS